MYLQDYTKKQNTYKAKINFSPNPRTEVAIANAKFKTPK